MKTIKILLGIIAINLTLLTIIQTGVWPPKVQASETNYSNILLILRSKINSSVMRNNFSKLSINLLEKLGK